MAAITQSLLSGISLPMLRVRAFFGHIGEALVERRLHNQQLRDLTSFSDRELWDVGLSRSDFMAIRDGTFRRD